MYNERPLYVGSNLNERVIFSYERETFSFEREDFSYDFTNKKLSPTIEINSHTNENNYHKDDNLSLLNVSHANQKPFRTNVKVSGINESISRHTNEKPPLTNENGTRTKEKILRPNEERNEQPIYFHFAYEYTCKCVLGRDPCGWAGKGVV